MEDYQRMNKSMLVAQAAEKLGFSKKDTGAVLDACIDVITEALKNGDRVQLVGFGCFEVRERVAREGRNPQKPEEKITIPATKVPVFKAGKVLKDEIK